MIVLSEGYFVLCSDNALELSKLSKSLAGFYKQFDMKCLFFFQISS